MNCPKCGKSVGNICEAEGWVKFSCQSFVDIRTKKFNQSDRCKLNQARELLRKVGEWDHIDDVEFCHILEIREFLKDTN